jgi:hypothetical protein
MTGPQLATLSTALWCVATTVLFILLAHWSAGGSWGITDGIVRGVRSWTGGPSEDLSPIRVSPGAIDPQPAGPTLERDAEAELVELGERPIVRL